VGPIIFWKINKYIVFQKRTKYKKKVPDNVKREILFKAHCDNLMRRFDRRMKRHSEKKVKSPIIETPQKPIALQEVSLSTSLQQLINACYINLYNLLDLPTMLHYFIFQRRLK